MSSKIRPDDGDVQYLAGSGVGTGETPFVTSVAPPPIGSMGNAEILRLVGLLAAEIAKASSATKPEAPLEPEIPIFGNFKKRILTSNIAKLVTGEIESSDADTSINTMAVVAALLLTIPFSLLGSLGQSYWDGMADLYASCPGKMPSTVQMQFLFVFNPLTSLVYMSMGAILTTVLYYLLRPSNNAQFKRWWRRGRWGIALILCLSVGAVVSAFCIFNQLVAAQYFMGFSKDLCNYDNAIVPRLWGTMAGGMGSVLLAIVIVGFVML